MAKNLNPPSDNANSLGRRGRRWKEGHIVELVDGDTRVSTQGIADAIEDMEGFSELLEEKAETGHTHTEFASLQAAMDSKADATAVAAGLESKADAEAVDMELAGLGIALDGKAPLSAGFFTATVVKTGANFAFTIQGLPAPLPPLIAVKALASADFSKNDTITINGSSVSLVGSGQKPLSGGAWKAGDGIELLWNTEGAQAFFKQGGGGGGSLKVFTGDVPPDDEANGVFARSSIAASAVLVDENIEIHVPGNTDGMEVGAEPGVWASDIPARPKNTCGAAATGIDNYVVFMGGTYYSSGTHALVADADAYDVESKTFSTLPAMPVSTTTGSKGNSIAVGKKIYVLVHPMSSPLEGVSTGIIFDWESKTYSSMANFPTALCGPKLATVEDEIYVIGSADRSLSSFASLLYDAGSNTYSSVAISYTVGAGFCGVAPYEKTLFIIGGRTVYKEYSSIWYQETRAVSMYDTDSRTTSHLPALTSGSEYRQVRSVGKSIVALESDGTCRQLDPTSQTWSAVASLPTASGEPAITGHKHTLYVHGGWTTNWSGAVNSKGWSLPFAKPVPVGSSHSDGTVLIVTSSGENNKVNLSGDEKVRLMVNVKKVYQTQDGYDVELSAQIKSDAQGWLDLSA